MKEATKYILDESRIPRYWYNMLADLPSPPPPVLHPGTMKPVGPDDLAPLFPMSLIAQEVTTEREVEIPGPVREIYKQWRPTALFRARRLEKALENAGAHLLQVRGREPRRQPQAQHRGGAGVLQHRSRGEAHRNRDRRGTMGLRARVRRRALRHRSAGLHGARLLRPEAVPARTHGNLRRALRALALERDAVRPRRAGEGRETSGQPRHRDLGSGRSRREPRRHQVRAGLGVEPRAAAPDGDRAGGDRAVRARRRLPGRHSRLHRRRLQLRRHRLPVPGRATARRQEGAHRRHRARGVPEPDPRPLRLRFRRHRAPDPACQDAHAGLDLHAARLSRRGPALSRHGAAREPREGAGADRGARLSIRSGASRRG